MIHLPVLSATDQSQVMTAVGAACRRAVMEADPRLVEAMYLCQLQASAEALSGGAGRGTVFKCVLKQACSLQVLSV